MLHIDDFDGPTTVETPEELERVLARRSGNDANAFWMLPVDKDFPVMCILVKGQLARVTYNAHEEDAGYVSAGRLEGLEPGEQSVFYTGPSEQEWVLNSTIIHMHDAVKGAREFLRSFELPKAIEWLRL